MKSLRLKGGFHHKEKEPLPFYHFYLSYPDPDPDIFTRCGDWQRCKNYLSGPCGLQTGFATGVNPFDRSFLEK